MSTLLPIAEIIKAGQVLKPVIKSIPLELNEILSERFSCNIYLKREDLQNVRSFKIRGAYNKMHSLSKKQLEKGVVCASAGNHAQGVAYSCRYLQAQGKIFMPVTTPKQKIDSVKRFGGQSIEVILAGDTFDDSNAAAMEYCTKAGMTFIHPFNDPLVIAGQGTIGLGADERSFEQNRLCIRDHRRRRARLRGWDVSQKHQPGNKDHRNRTRRCGLHESLVGKRRSRHIGAYR